MSTQVTLIIPVYNTLRYLEACMDSVLRQTHADLDVVLVDDGSTDGSWEACQGFAARDPRVRCMQVAHGGQAAARNAALGQARGQVVGFVDSDDVVSPVFVQVLLQAMQDTGRGIAAVPFGTKFYDGEEPGLLGASDGFADECPCHTIDEIDYQRMLMYQQVECGAVYRLYNRHLLGDEPFPVGVVYEDLATTYRFAHGAGRVALVQSNRLYGYRQHTRSTMTSTSPSLLARSSVTVADQLHDEVCTWYPQLSTAAASRCFSVARTALTQMAGADERERSKVWDLIHRYRSTVLRDKHARRRECLAAAVAMLGPTAFSWFCAATRRVGLQR